MSSFSRNTAVNRRRLPSTVRHRGECDRISRLDKHRYLACIRAAYLYARHQHASARTAVARHSLQHCAHNCVIKANTLTIAGTQANTVPQTTSWRHESVDAPHNTMRAPSADAPRGTESLSRIRDGVAYSRNRAEPSKKLYVRRTYTIRTRDRASERRQREQCAG